MTTAEKEARYQVWQAFRAATWADVAELLLMLPRQDWRNKARAIHQGLARADQVGQGWHIVESEARRMLDEIRGAGVLDGVL